MSGRAQARLRLGVVGCGRAFERFHLPAVRAGNDWTLAAICETDAGRRSWVTQVAPDVELFENLGRLLACGHTDAVVIATPPHTHAPLACQALDSGLAVLVEKPMALLPAEADRMLDASRRANRPLCVGFNRRFRRPYRKLHELLRRTTEGSVSDIRFRLVLDAAGRGGIRDDGLDDVASHQLDLLPWLFDRPIAGVRATPASPTPSGGDRYQFEVRLADGLTIECVAAHADSYEEMLTLRLAGRAILCHPTGLMHVGWMPRLLAEGWAGVVTFLSLAKHRLRHTPNVTVDSFIQQLAAFAKVVRRENSEEGSLPATAEQGARCVRAVAACRESFAAVGSWRPIE